ncbi:hypothetical protein AB0469_34185 [Streptomyces sp. NPDC093801]|uniref:hypothetical protein n=1 Tax=Streptomyces sp. NPDC093801 TaxID=3155203 RepID=UPI00344D894C
MTTPPSRLLHALDRFNSAHPRHHNAHYHRRITRQLPGRFGAALDVGCGTGGLARLRGTLAVVGLWRARTPADHLLGAAAVPLNAAMGRLKNRGRTAEPPASMTAPVRSATMTFAEVVREARRVLPGARIRRRLFWRYTPVWHRG